MKVPKHQEMGNIEPNYEKLLNESNEDEIDVLHGDSSHSTSITESENMESLSLSAEDTQKGQSSDVEEMSNGSESNDENVDFRQ